MAPVEKSSNKSAHTKKKIRKISSVNKKNKKTRTNLNYPREALAQAIEAIKSGSKGVREACREFGVPRTTVQDRLSGRISEDTKKVGPDPLLGFEGEQKIVDWIIDSAKCGLPINKEVLLETVKKILIDMGKGDKIPEGKRPGQTWYKSFLRRHPEISIREAEGINKAREAVKESAIRNWFNELTLFLNENGWNDVMKDPERIFNADETGVSLCPNTGKVLAPKGYKNVYTVKKGNEKETLTVLITMSASGKICPPLVVFPYVRPPKAVVENMLEGWVIGKTDSGWMRSDVFYEYLANDFNTWLEENNVKRPIIFFVDGHKSHMSIQLSTFCDENDIILYALPPNTTHITQPADVSVFRPLKQEWRKTLNMWQSKPENANKTVTKLNFCKVFKEALDKDMIQTIRNGFRKCGLFPFNVEAVDFSKCVKDFQQRKRKSAVMSSELTDRDYTSAQKVIGSIKDNLTKQGIDADAICCEIERVRELARKSLKERRSNSKTPRTSTEVVCTPIKASKQMPSQDETVANTAMEGGETVNSSFFEDICIPDVGSLVSLNDISLINLSDINLENPLLTLTDHIEDVPKTRPSSPSSQNEVTSHVVIVEMHDEILAKDKNINMPKSLPSPLKDVKHVPKLKPSLSPDNVVESNVTVEVQKVSKNNEKVKILQNILLPPIQKHHNKIIKSPILKDEDAITEYVVNEELKNEIGKEDTIKVVKSANDIIIDPFKKHLNFVTKFTEKNTKKKNPVKLPSAISEKKWRNYYEAKEKEKQNKIDEKNKRKTEREQNKCKAAVSRNRKVGVKKETKIRQPINKKAKCTVKAISMKETSEEDDRNYIEKIIEREIDENIEKTLQKVSEDSAEDERVQGAKQIYIQQTETENKKDEEENDEMDTENKTNIIKNNEKKDDNIFNIF